MGKKKKTKKQQISELNRGFKEIYGIGLTPAEKRKLKKIKGSIF